MSPVESLNLKYNIHDIFEDVLLFPIVIVWYLSSRGKNANLCKCTVKYVASLYRW